MQNGVYSLFDYGRNRTTDALGEHDEGMNDRADARINMTFDQTLPRIKGPTGTQGQPNGSAASGRLVSGLGCLATADGT